jgi:hypothetical protein
VETFGARTETWRYPESSEATRCAMIFRCPLAHAAVMMRRSLFCEEGFAYDPEARHVEDFDLWLRVAETHEVANVPKVLLRYRLHAEQVSSVHAGEQQKRVIHLQLRWLRECLGIEPTAREQAIHEALAFSRLEGTDRFVEEAENWLLKVAKANEARAAFPREALLRTLVGRWVSVQREGVRCGRRAGDPPTLLAPFVHAGAL